MNTFMLGAQKRTTRAFILEDSIVLEFTRVAQIPDGAGGFISGDTPVTFREIVRLIPQSDQVPVASQIEGYLTITQYILLAEFDSPIKPRDTFTLRGIGYRVEHEHPTPAYEKKFDVFKITGGEPV